MNQNINILLKKKKISLKEREVAKSFTEYSNDKKDIYKNIGEYN